MQVSLATLQFIMLILWYTLFPTLPAWLVFLPLIIIGIILITPVVVIVGAAIAIWSSKRGL